MSDTITGKSIAVAVAMTAVGVLVTYFMTKTLTTVEAGSEALETAQITEAITTVLDARDKVIIGGKTMTMAEAVSAIAREQALQRQVLDALVE